MRWEALQKRLEAVQERRRDRERETRRRMQAADRHHQARERREVRPTAPVTARLRRALKPCLCILGHRRWKFCDPTAPSVWRSGRRTVCWLTRAVFWSLAVLVVSARAYSSCLYLRGSRPVGLTGVSS